MPGLALPRFSAQPVRLKDEDLRSTCLVFYSILEREKKKKKKERKDAEFPCFWCWRTTQSNKRMPNERGQTAPALFIYLINYSLA